MASAANTPQRGRLGAGSGSATTTGIGVGTFGCYSEYSAASYALEKEIPETSKEMEWAAEMLRAVAADLDNTDNSVGDNFAGVRKKIDDYDHPSLPGSPTPSGNRSHYE